MRSLTLLATAALSTFAIAQSPLVTLAGGTNSGNPGGGIYFNLQVNSTITINRIDFQTGAAAGLWVPPVNGVLDVYLGPTTYVGNVTNPALWAIVASAPVNNVNASTMIQGTLTTPFCLGPGNYGVALKSNAFNHGYTNGTGTAVPGSGTNQTFTNTELVLRGGAAQNMFLSGPVFEPRVFNGQIHYTLGGTPIAVASWQQYGRGCYAMFNSFYHMMGSTATGMIGLANTTGGTNSITLTFAGTGYSVGALNTNGTFFTPTSTALVMANNSVTTVTPPFPVIYPTTAGPQVSTTLEINDNGCVTPTGTNGGLPPAGASAVQLFLAGQPRWCNWHDFDPAGTAVPGTPVPPGGGVFFDIDPSNQSCYVTWNTLPDAGITASQMSTFQLAFTSTGSVEFRWKAMSLSGGGSWPTLVGWTPGGGAVDPGSIDLVTSPAFLTGPRDNPPLTLEMSARPRLNTTPVFITSNIPAGTSLGAAIFGFGQHDPGLPLAFLGMPGCLQFVNLAGAVSQVFIVSGTSANTPLFIPNLPQLNGVLVFAQSASFSSGFNPLGVIASNGVRMFVGSL